MRCQGDWRCDASTSSRPCWKRTRRRRKFPGGLWDFWQLSGRLSTAWRLRYLLGSVEDEPERIEATSSATSSREPQGQPMRQKSKPMPRPTIVIDPKPHFSGGKIMSEEEETELHRLQEKKRKFPIFLLSSLSLLPYRSTGVQNSGSTFRSPQGSGFRDGAWVVGSL